MNLTAQQLEEVRSGKPVRLSAPEIGTECVLIRADLYERFQALLDADDFDAKEGLPFANMTMEEDDAGDPLLESYQKYRRTLERGVATLSSWISLTSLGWAANCAPRLWSRMTRTIKDWATPLSS
jgi:hypothetical protein